MIGRALLLLQAVLLLGRPHCSWSYPLGPFFHFNPSYISGVLDHRGNINNIGLFDMRTLQHDPNSASSSSSSSTILLNYDTNPRNLALQRRAEARKDLLQYVWFAPYYNRPLYEEIRDLKR